MGPGQSPLRKLLSAMDIILRDAVDETNKKLPESSEQTSWWTE